jgi:ABC-2 type transport system permease protein
MGLLAKHGSVFVVYFKECFAYPAATMIWVVVDVQAALILPAVWLAAIGPGGTVAGFTGREIVTYYLMSSVVSQFVVCHLQWDIAWDIREGTLSSMLLRPFSFFRQTVSRNLSWRVTKVILFLPVLALAMLAYGGVASDQLHPSWIVVIALILGHWLSFLCAFCVALVTLWTTEFFSIFRLYFLPEAFLSGRILPLATMPDWVQEISKYLPFQYTVAFPLELLMGRMPSDRAFVGLIAQVLWCVALFGLGKHLMARGLRNYTGVGM